MTHDATHLDVAERLATILDDQFSIGPFKFGLDPIVGVIPVVGDIIPLVVGLYILWIGGQMRVPGHLRYKMLANTVGDAVVGAIPVVGDLTDFVWKSNLRNIKLLREYLAKQPIEGKIIAATNV